MRVDQISQSDDGISNDDVRISLLKWESLPIRSGQATVEALAKQPLSENRAADMLLNQATMLILCSLAHTITGCHSRPEVMDQNTCRSQIPYQVSQRTVGVPHSRRFTSAHHRRWSIRCDDVTCWPLDLESVRAQWIVCMSWTALLPFYSVSVSIQARRLIDSQLKLSELTKWNLPFYPFSYLF